MAAPVAAPATKSPPTAVTNTPAPSPPATEKKEKETKKSTLKIKIRLDPSISASPAATSAPVPVPSPPATKKLKSPAASPTSKKTKMKMAAGPVAAPATKSPPTLVTNIPAPSPPVKKKKKKKKKGKEKEMEADPYGTMFPASSRGVVLGHHQEEGEGEGEGGRSLWNSVSSLLPGFFWGFFSAITSLATKRQSREADVNLAYALQTATPSQTIHATTSSLSAQGKEICGSFFSAKVQILTVMPGEDIDKKLMAMPRHGATIVSVLSASGTVSNVTFVPEPITTGRSTSTFEGAFAILGLSGTVTIEGCKLKAVLTVGSHGQVIGGTVAGGLVATKPAEVVVQFLYNLEDK